MNGQQWGEVLTVRWLRALRVQWARAAWIDFINARDETA